MSTLGKTKSQFRRAFVPTTALAKSVEFDSDMMHVLLTDGRIMCSDYLVSPISGCISHEDKKLWGGLISAPRHDDQYDHIFMGTLKTILRCE